MDLALYVCPCCNRVTGSPEPCAKFRQSRERRGRLAWWIALLALASGCAHPNMARAYRVRFEAIKTSAIIYERGEHADRQCRKHIRKWEKATGKVHVLDNGEPAKPGQGYRGCKVEPVFSGGYKHIITSLETIDNFCHELCHALGAPNAICEKIHFDGRYYPGRTIVVEDPLEYVSEVGQ